MAHHAQSSPKLCKDSGEGLNPRSKRMYVSHRDWDVGILRGTHSENDVPTGLNSRTSHPAWTFVFKKEKCPRFSFEIFTLFHSLERQIECQGERKLPCPLLHSWNVYRNQGQEPAQLRQALRAKIRSPTGQQRPKYIQRAHYQEQIWDWNSGIPTWGVAVVTATPSTCHSKYPIV